jgi:hypothetical protein
MSPEEADKLRAEIKELRDIVASLDTKGLYTIRHSMKFSDGRDLVFSEETGSQIGTDSNQKIGFFGATPVTYRS